MEVEVLPWMIGDGKEEGRKSVRIHDSNLSETCTNVSDKNKKVGGGWVEHTSMSSIRIYSEKKVMLQEKNCHKSATSLQPPMATANTGLSG